jgi:Putative addiction module component
MQLSADQIVEETSDWPEDAVADLVDRILRAKYGEVDAPVDKAWQDEIRRRLAEMESGRVQVEDFAQWTHPVSSDWTHLGWVTGGAAGDEFYASFFREASFFALTPR